MEEISHAMFEGCTELVQVVIHPSTLGIASYAFQGCKKLKELKLNIIYAQSYCVILTGHLWQTLLSYELHL